MFFCVHRRQISTTLLLIAAAGLPPTMAFQNRVAAFMLRPTVVPPSCTFQKATTRIRISSPCQIRLFSLKEEIDPGTVAGTDLKIVKYPHPALRAKNEDVTLAELKDGSAAQLAKEMFLVMYAAEGVGLAAPQVGVNKRLMVYNPSGDRKKWLEEIVMVNPKIVAYSEAREVSLEACLSFPNMSGDVERSKWIKIESLSLKGKKIKRKLEGWTAKVFQHEYDHLDGIVYIDRLTDEGRADVQPRLDELTKEFEKGNVYRI